MGKSKVNESDPAQPNPGLHSGSLFFSGLPQQSQISSDYIRKAVNLDLGSLPSLERDHPVAQKDGGLAYIAPKRGDASSVLKSSPGFAGQDSSLSTVNVQFTNSENVQSKLPNHAQLKIFCLDPSNLKLNQFSKPSIIPSSVEYQSELGSRDTHESIFANVTEPKQIFSGSCDNVFMSSHQENPFVTQDNVATDSMLTNPLLNINGKYEDKRDTSQESGLQLHAEPAASVQRSLELTGTKITGSDMFATFNLSQAGEVSNQGKTENVE